MLVALLMTDGGPHPPEKLSGVTTQRFLDDFREHAPAAAYAEVERFRDQIDRVMSTCHRMVQDDERAELEDKGPARIAEPIDLDEAVEHAVDQIYRMIGATSEWATLGAYLNRPETRDYFAEILHKEFHHAVWIERSWASHGVGMPKHPHLSWHDPDHPAAAAFRGVATHGHAILQQPHPEDEGQDVVRLSPLDEHGGRDMVEAVIAASQHGPKRLP